MDIALTDEHLQLQRTARELFDAQSTIAVVRQQRGRQDFSRALWQSLVDLDSVGLTVPRELGGSGAELLDLWPIYVEMGRSLAVSPHLPVTIACETLAAAATTEAHRALVRGMARGEGLVIPATLEPSGEYGAEGVAISAAGPVGDRRLTGRKVMVPFAADATHFLVPLRETDGAVEIVVALVEAGREGITVEPSANVTGVPVFQVDFDELAIRTDDLLGDGDTAWAALDRAMQRGALLRCAEVVGAGERALEMVLDYANARSQFGNPIGRYQAVQYLCSDMAIAIHLTDLFGRSAAHAASRHLPDARQLAMANAYGSAAAQHIMHCAHEVFAGVAFMEEHDLHLFTRRAKYWELDLGDARHHRDLVTASLAADPPPTG